MRVDPRYVDGTYGSENPGWHEEDAAWKAARALELIREEGLAPRTVCDIGCGTGGVLRELARVPGLAEELVGIDVSPQAIEAAEALPHPASVSFRLWDGGEGSERFDLALVMDVVEHVPDYLGFLAEIAVLAERFVFHLPLDMNAQGVARGRPLMHARAAVGHLHYFSKDTALASLGYAGYVVEAWRFTPSSELVEGAGPGRRAFSALRSRLAARWPEPTARVLGGSSLLVLARPEPGPGA